MLYIDLETNDMIAKEKDSAPEIIQLAAVTSKLCSYSSYVTPSNPRFKINPEAQAKHKCSKRKFLAKHES